MTRVLPTIGGDPNATRVMPLVGPGDTIGPAGTADAEMTQVLPRTPASAGPWQGTDDDLPREWFRDPQAEYDGVLGGTSNSPAPVFNPPEAPHPSYVVSSAPVKESKGRRLGPVLVTMLVVVILVLIGVVWWVLSNLTSKADGQIQPVHRDTVAAASLLSGSPQSAFAPQSARAGADPSDPLDAA